MDIWIPLALVAAGIAALVLEIFLPAGGIIGIGGFFSMTAGVIMAFRVYGSGAGLGVMFFTLIAAPLVILSFLKLFPKTFIGRRLILDDPLNPVVLKNINLKKTDKDSAADNQTDTGREVNMILQGDEGTAFTDLRPSGTGIIKGKKISVVSTGDFINKNSPILVVKAEGSRIVVKKNQQPNF